MVNGSRLHEHSAVGLVADYADLLALGTPTQAITATFTGYLAS